jgi:GAF domain-containing protein
VTLRNGLKSRARRDVGFMARVLLLGACALMASACLIPQDDDVLPDLPPKKNSPPRILAQTVQPAQRKTSVVVGTPSPTCLRTEFSMTVEDEDTGDLLRSQWYVDPRPDYQNTASTPVFAGAVIFGGTSVNRTVTAPNAMLTFLSSLNDGKEHLIEAWVTDGEFDPNAAPTQVTRPDRTLPDGTSVPDTAYSDANVWVITRVESCP